MIEKLTELENKVLGCWCKDNCHGEILIKLYREFVANEKNWSLKREFVEYSHQQRKAKMDDAMKRRRLMMLWKETLCMYKYEDIEIVFVFFK